MPATPKKMTVLVTGAAGFVGSHTVDLLVDRGHEVVALDALVPQVHGQGATRPVHLLPHLERKAIRFHHGDVRDRALLERLIGEVDAIVHLAAAVGLGQSMYMPHPFADVNIGGTALLMDVLINTKHRVRKVVVASSMSLYGEGACHCNRCGLVYPTERSGAQLAAHEWELYCPTCGEVTAPAPTPESKPLSTTTVYAISKKVQEELLVLYGRAYHMPVVALRYFNIYGPRQSLNNPYTGVAAIFLSRILNGNVPLAFEDGLQSRDFVHVRDVAAANLLALESSRDGQAIYNVGTGRSTTILELARLLNEGLGTSVLPKISYEFRAGDIRHCTADTSLIARELGYAPKVDPADGFRELIAWSRTEKPVDTFDTSLSELKAKGLLQ